MSLADVCIRRPVFATMLIMALVVLGWFSFARLGLDLFPNVDFPVVTIKTTLKGASVEEIESGVTKPIEEIVNTIEGIDTLRSTSKEGLSVVVVQFVLSKDSAVAAQEVRDKVSTIVSRLPQGTDPPIMEKFDVDAAPIMSVVVAGNRNLREVTEIAKKQIKERIETVTGVGAVIMVGGWERAVNVYVDPDRMAAYQISILQVKEALQRQNIEIPGGRVDEGHRELVLRTMGRMEDVSAFADLIVSTHEGRPIRIRDIGRVDNGIAEPRSRARLNDKNAVSLIVKKQSGTNVVAVVDAVKAKLAELRPVLPADVTTEVVVDQSRFIKRTIAEVQHHLILGAILVALTVWLFMRDVRSTLIASVAIPTSIIATFTIMRLMDFTLNNVTMLGLVLAVGIVIDDAVVILENIFRHIEERGETPYAAASIGTREIALAVMATTLSLVVIFLPIAFMGGIIGRFFQSFGVTVAVAIAISLLVSFTLTPMLSSRFLRPKGAAHSAKDSRFYRAIDRFYGACLRWSLRHRAVILLLALAVTLTTGPLMRAVGTEFVPQDDQSEFEVIIQTPGGYNLERTDALTQELEAKFRRLRGVEETLTMIGDTTGTSRPGEGDVTSVSIYVRLVDLGERAFSQFAVMNDVRAVLAAYPDLRASVQVINAVRGGGTRQSELEFSLLGPSLEKLTRYAEQLAARMQADPGFVDVDTTLAVRKPELRAAIDRERASALGLRVEEIAQTLSLLVGGEPVSKYKEEDEQYDVWLRAEPSKRSNPADVYALTVWSPSAQLVRIYSLVNLEEALGPAQIERENRQRKVGFFANLSGIPLSVAMQKVQGFVREMDMPPQYEVMLGGHAKALEETVVNFLTAFLLSLLFMYMVLAAQFESFLHPVTIMLAVPLSIPFAVFSLWLLRSPLDVFSIFGLFMLFGIVKKNGILQIDYTNTLRAEGRGRDEAIIEANHARLRPILMTSAMLVFGMLPMALGTGPGAASRASMAKVIIGGQTLCLLLSLLVTPVAYALFDDLGGLDWLARLRAPGRWVAARRRGRGGAAANGRVGARR
ncbi:MAG: RND transporter [Polyangiaceae bacterium UTPRO1]|jgi:HAE1 family hydrophobic/amphiphilic exporter-1|nr:efflux RND transporter permease subunit [Myxococcales bacterium]OQY67819.1 MAG: RND transporter [Polyangiaceae bacterium UTPRO1]